MDSIKIFRQNSALECSCWPAKHKVILEIAPAYPDKPKGQPQPGSKLYDYTKKIKISFGPNDILKFRYALLKHSNGEAEDYKKMADMSKVAGSTDTDKKSLGVNLNANGGVGFFLSKGTERLNIVLDKSDAFALAEWLLATYNGFYLAQIVASLLNIAREGGSDDDSTDND